VTISLSLLLAHFWRRRENELAASLLQAEHGRDLFARLFHGAPASTLILALADKHIVDVNESFCQRYGVTREEAVGSRPMDLGIGPIEQDRAEFWRQLTVEGRVRNLVSRVRLKNGDIHESLINGELIDYEGQRCALAISLDITELRQSERAREALAVAEAANRAKTEFLSRMSHELRTPLNAVIGFSELLRDEAQGRLTPPERAQLDHIHQAGWYLLTLTNEVLDISRIEAGQFHVDLRPLALGALLGDAMQLSRALAAQHAVALAPLPPGVANLAVTADAVRLQQVVLNLLSNAIKYNRPGGTVRIEAAGDTEGQVRLEVIDDGLGMTNEQLAHLFEPFNRLGRERGGIEGAGVGLALTRQLVRLMHGRIEIGSEVGTGTRARVWLPAAQLPASDAEAAESPPEGHAAPAIAPSAAGAGEPRGTVLYVEDNPVNALLVEQLLARWPSVRFVHAEDGENGIALARTLRPDVLLLDMQLPDMGGAEVLRRLRNDETTSGLRVIALSANAMAEDMAQARENGASDYWTKPIDIAHFLAEMRTLLGVGAA
jgi:PAS domain S-box-containing protein